jgi:hypothetical protein
MTGCCNVTRRVCVPPIDPVSSAAESLYLHRLQRPESPLIYLRYNIHQVHRRHNLINTALNRVPEVVLAARLVRQLSDSGVLHMIG